MPPSGPTLQHAVEPGLPGPVTRLARLRHIASAVNAGGDIETILDRVLLAVCSGEPWPRGGIMAVNRASGFSELVTGYDPEGVMPGRPRRWPLATSPVSIVAETRRPLVIQDAQRSQDYPGYQEDAQVRNYRTVALLPLGCTNAEEHEMVLSLHTRDRIQVTGEELDFLTTAAHLVALAVEKAKHLRREQRHRDRLRRVLEAGAGLMELVLDGAAFPVVARAAGAMLRHPVLILDFVTGQTFARGSPLPECLDERRWRELAQGPAAAMLAGLPAASAPGELVRLDLSPFGVPGDARAVTEPLRVDGETAGLVLIFPADKAMDSLDWVAAQEVRFAVAAHVMRHHAEARRGAQDLADLLDYVFRTGAAEPARAQARAARLGVGLDLNGRIRLLSLALDHPGAGLGEVRRVLAESLGRSIPGAFAIEQAETIAILLPEAEPLPDAVLERLLVAPIRARWGVRPQVARGPLCTEPGHYGPAWAECRRVLDLARMFGRHGLVRQVDFGPSALLLSAFDGDLVHTFVEESLGALKRHDAEQGGALLETAEAFIDLACRYQAAAEQLGIHVSTLRYRLGRLKELFGLDLSEPETRFRLSLALRLSGMGSRSEKA